MRIETKLKHSRNRIVQALAGCSLLFLKEWCTLLERSLLPLHYTSVRTQHFFKQNLRRVKIVVKLRFIHFKGLNFDLSNFYTLLSFYDM